MIANYVAITDHVITLDSEADMEFLLNNIDLSGLTWSVVAKGGQFTFVAIEGGPVVIPEVAAVLARMSALTQQETDAITKFVTNEVQALGNNWAKIDEFFSFGLNATDRLTGFKLKTGALVGAPTFTIEGVDTDGVNQAINTDWNPSVDRVNYGANNAMTGVFVIIERNPRISNRNLFGAQGVVSSFIRQNTSVRYQAFLNGSGFNDPFGAPVPSSLLIQQVTDRHQGWRDGIRRTDSPRTGVSGFTTDTFRVAAATNGSGTSNNFFNGIISTAMMGAPVGFQTLVHYNNLLEYLIDLGTFINPVLARYTGLSPLEISSITNYVHREVRAGNWQKTDEFFCFALSGANALIGMKAITATNTNAVALSIEGATFDGGARWIDSNWDASLSTLFELNNAAVGVFKISDTSSATGVMAGAITGTGRLQILSNTPRYPVNDNTGQNSFGNPTPNNSLIIARRTGASAKAVYVNGSEDGNQSLPSTVKPSGTLIIGGNNFDGTKGNQFRGVLSSFIVGAAIGFDQAAHYQNHLEFLIELGVFSQPVIDRYSALSPTEEEAIRAFVNQEVRDLNWGKYDEFFCFALNATDRLIGMKTKTATNNGATFDINGAIFDGASEIDTNFDYVADGVNFTQNNAFASVFMFEWSTLGSQWIFGSRSGGNDNIRFDKNNTSVFFGLNQSSGEGGAWAAPTFNVPTLLTTNRLTSAASQLFSDGVFRGQATRVAIPLQGVNATIGARGGTQFFTGQISVAALGGALADTTAHNTNVRTLLTALGVTLP